MSGMIVHNYFSSPQCSVETQITSVHEASSTTTNVAQLTQSLIIRAKNMAPYMNGRISIKAIFLVALAYVLLLQLKLGLTIVRENILAPKGYHHASFAPPVRETAPNKPKLFPHRVIDLSDHASLLNLSSIGSRPLVPRGEPVVNRTNQQSADRTEKLLPSREWNEHV